MTETGRRPAGAMFWTYLALAVVGLVLTWSANLAAMAQGRDYLGDWFGSGPAVLSASFDLLVLLVVAAIFVLVEGRRLGMRRTWVYVVLMPLVALAFALPLFLAMRERALSR